MANEGLYLRDIEWFTLGQLAAHAGKHVVYMRTLAKASGLRLHRIPLLRGYRVTGKDARKFMRQHWPEVPPLPSQFSHPPSSLP